jgi:hypothetical protein
MTRDDVRELVELGAVFVLLFRLLGFIHKGGFGTEAIVGALAGAVLFALIPTVGALSGMVGGKTQPVRARWPPALFPAIQDLKP